MRIFTEKDLSAVTAAFQVFLRHMDGKTRQVKTLRPVVETALSGGITLDELFNKNNYVKVIAAIGEAVSPEEYVGALAANTVPVTEITKETDWANDYDNITVLAEVFHRFFIEIKAKGGHFNTDSARLNLERAIRRFGLQPILSEELIKEVSEAQGDKFTCFNYLVALLHKTEDYEIVLDPTEDTVARREVIAATVSAVIGEEPEKEDTKEAPEPNPKGSFEGVSEEDENDPSVYGIQPRESDEWGEVEWPDEDGVNLITKDPATFKRDCVMGAVLALSLPEACALAKTVNEGEPASIELLVEALCEGDFNPELEDLTARSAHQGINNDITPAFMECVRLQGFELNEDTVQKYDPLKDSWDMRDENTRKLQKVTRLVYTCGEGDPDLKEALKDLEKLYEKKQ